MMEKPNKQDAIRDKLIIITNNYPFGGRTEEAFLKDEIIALSSCFKSVVIMPMWKESDCFDISLWPYNVTVDAGLSEQSRELGKKRLLYFFRWDFFKALLVDLFCIRNRKQLEYLIRTFVEGSALKQYFLSLVKGDLLDVNKTVIYSFWFADNSVGLGLIPKEIMPRWISRAHHYDLYNDRVPLRSRLFRDNSFSNVEKVLCCSHHGENYLISNYPKWRSKIETLYLGTSKPLQIPEYKSVPNTLNFVTVARMEPVKRPLQTFTLLNCLAKQYPAMEISWTFVGGGSIMDQMKETVTNNAETNLHVELLGERQNSFVQTLFSRRSFEWMILLSESEGLPISIAEAMSYGIPSIATDVGGVCEEVISGISGILLASNPVFEDFFREISIYISNENKYLELRNTSIDFWRNHLDGDKLKKTLAQILSEQ